MSNKLDLINQKFGKGTVLSKKYIKNYIVFWELECDCGNRYLSCTGSLRSGNCKSCGCIQADFAKNINWAGYKDIPKTYFNDITNKAKKRNIIIDIDIEYIWSVFIQQDRKCALSGIDLFFTKGKLRGNASLDRIDNNNGYIKNNVQWLHKDINRMKSNFNQDYFLTLCRKIILK